METPTPKPAGAPQAPTPNNIEDLIYKTMPKADGQSFSRPPVQPYMPPTPAAKPVIPAMPQAPASPASSAPAAPAPLPASMTPVSKSDTLLGGIPASISHAGKLRAALGALIGVVVIGGALVVYLKFFANKTTAPAADTAQNTVATGSVNQNPQPASQIPDQWRVKYFGAAVCANQDNCGDSADPDHDGLTNLEEFQANTDPNNADSDKDGIADGDEVHIFGYDPTTNDTSGNPKYMDSGEPAAKWNAKANRAYTSDELITIGQNIAKYGWHSPTTATLSKDVIDFYTNQNTPAGTSSNTPQPGALDRDTQRLDAIKQVGFALLKYKQASFKYPDVGTFTDMIKLINPLLSGKAVNTTDPLNTGQYVYSYQSVNKGADFKLGYFSETQNQAIVLTATDVQKMSADADVVQRDTQRKSDLEQLVTALQLYSNDHISGTDANERIFPTQDQWKPSLAPTYIGQIPTDPLTHKDYTYTVSSDNSSFALQAVMENPPTGKKGYSCGPDSCDYY